MKKTNFEGIFSKISDKEKIIKNCIIYDTLHKNIAAILINLIRSDMITPLYEAAEKTASFMICFSLSVILLKNLQSYYFFNK
ncbi:hypothetical protein KFV54_11620 [Staphylococcus epidermidis]|uniref:hypothetical protein n=1 Tax=Staphylococcus epidermidis TaxID=1282 RepID=UPI0012B95F35|nr:hypothetical protein [Staphylococcus epidermidis]MBM6305563.1 hypothetical protein [Staphylococcus epidermidis]MBM6317840.1 hypothetical protein [Staphylococcus epidermidis]QXU78714.1 hypothetical protein KFV55_13090 [Staphylococcus epidermidis]QXU96046.1 hypothetical protein KFV54_11620 [Staphylococcus epidermidis]